MRLGVGLIAAVLLAIVELAEPGAGWRLGAARAQLVSCEGSGLAFSPSTVSASSSPATVSYVAHGFEPRTTVVLSIVSAPPGWGFSEQVPATADASCRASGALSVGPCPGCPGGTITLQASGTRFGGGPLTVRGSFTVLAPQVIASPTVPVPSSCLSPLASVTPSTVVQGGQTSFFAQGFGPGSLAALQIIGPGTATQIMAHVSNACLVSTTIQVLPSDPPGSYTVQASGTGHNGEPLTLSAFFTVVGAGPPPTVGPTATPTSSVVCPLPSAFVSPARLSTEVVGTFGGVGFRPGAMVRVDFEDPAGLFSPPFFAPTEVGPATTTCAVSGTFSVNPTVPPGRYRLTLTGPTHLGSIVQARSEFEVVVAGQPPIGPSPVVVPPVETPRLPTPVPVDEQAEIQELVREGQNLVIDQTLTLIGGPPVPAVGQTNTYEHVVRISNPTGRAQDLRGLQIASLEALLAAAQQGSTISFATEYQETRIVSAVADVGRASVRGSTVVWDGQLAAGQTVEVRATIDHTPTTAFSLTQPIRGQTLTVTNPRGLSVSVPPPPLPQLPPAQRLVQPAPPPVDPILGDRYFPDTGFTVANDDIWVFYHRRGGARTFGWPISRDFTLGGGTVQLFERGMLQVDAEGNVSTANLLEEPFLPYDSLGDLRLPVVAPELIDSAPDPGAEDFGTQSQEFVRLNAPESFEGDPTRFYATFLSAVLFRDAFFDGRGDPNLVPGFCLEIWGLPTSAAGYQVIGTELVVGEDGLVRAVDVVDPGIVLLRFQRGVMRYVAAEESTAAALLGYYVRAILVGETENAELVAVAESSPLWAQYNPEVADWVDRPDDLPDTNLVLAFEPE